MKRFIISFLLLFWFQFIYSQNKIDSLNRLISKATSDTQRINLEVAKLIALGNGNLDSAIAFAKSIINEAKKNNYKKGEANAELRMAGDYCFKGEYKLAKETLDTAKEISLQVKDSSALAKIYDTYGFMYSMQNKFDTSHLFFKKAIEFAQEQKDNPLLSTIFQNEAIAYQQQSNYAQALTYYQKALTISEQLNDENDEAFIYLNIAIAYNTLDDKIRAEESFFKAINFAKKLNLKNVEAYAYANLSSLYADINRYSEQYEFGMKAAVLGKQMGDEGIEASSLSRAAMALASQNKFKEAESLNRQSMVIVDSSGQPYNIYQAYSDMGHILTKEKEYNKAIPYFEKAFHSLTDADIYNLEVGVSYFDLSECYEKAGNYIKALATYKISTQIIDSVNGKENVKKTTELTMNYEFEKKQQVAKVEQKRKDDIAKEELRRQKLIRNSLISAFIVMLLFASIFFTQRNKIKKGKKRSDELLLNILPEEVAEELKQKGNAAAKHFEEVTVMFTDFKDFTAISEKLTPAELIAEIDYCFKAFDNIMDKHNIEKIKTIGDSYMCAGGLPVANKTNAKDVVNAASEIQQFMKKYFQQRKNENKEPFEMRIGIHTGPVVAGIVGVKKFAYDIWGDTVNIASRMESSGTAGEVNISGATYELVKDKFNCTYRGKIQAKNKGQIDMYFVENIF